MRLFFLCLFSAGLAFGDDALLRREPVASALNYIESAHERTLESQVKIAEIAAPTFHEQERAQYMASEFRRVGLENVEVDKQGNVLGWRAGESGDVMVLAAHLDIAFDPSVKTKVRKDGARWFGPGLGDDSRGLADLLVIAEALNAANIRTHQTILFVANVGEEGNGDLNGVHYLFQEGPYRDRLRAFISIDGWEPASITTGGTGVKRYRIVLHGSGGHSYADFGRASTIHAAARIIDRLSNIQVPKTPKTTFNVGRISGGTSVNAIAEECSFEVDLRSEDPGELDKIEARLLEAVRLGVGDENQARAASKTTVQAENQLIGNRPAGRTAEVNPLVQSAMWAERSRGFVPKVAFQSTDANLPMSLGIPAVTLGGGGKGGNAHSLEEWFEPAEAWKGPQGVLLTILDFDEKQRARR